MKKYLEYRNQIEGYKNVSETIKIAEKVAASNIHFLKTQVKTLEIYTNEIQRILERLSLFHTDENHQLLLERHGGKKALIVISGNKGLVGELYHNVINFLLDRTKNYQSLIVIGKKGEDYLKEEGIQIDKSFSHISESPNSTNIKEVAEYTFREFQRGNFVKIDILFPRFISLSEHRPAVTRLLPFKFTSLQLNQINSLTDMDSNDAPGFPIFEPSKKNLFDQLLKKYISVFFYRIVLEAKLSELSARVITTEHAAVKTKELLQNLERTLTKERRKNITQKQLESYIAHHV